MVPVREKSGVTALLAASSLADDDAPDWHLLTWDLLSGQYQ